MSEQVVYLTAQNSRLSQQVEELKAKLSNVKKNNNETDNGNNINNNNNSNNSNNNIRFWTFTHLMYILNKYHLSIDKVNIEPLCKKFIRLNSGNDCIKYFNECKKITKDWIDTNQINTIARSGITKIALIQTGFYLETKNKIDDMRKIATQAGISDDTLKSLKQAIISQKCLESVYNDVYDI